MLLVKVRPVLLVKVRPVLLVHTIVNSHLLGITIGLVSPDPSMYHSTPLSTMSKGFLKDALTFAFCPTFSAFTSEVTRQTGGFRCSISDRGSSLSLNVTLAVMLT